jgi:hypothetical protein
LKIESLENELEELKSLSSESHQIRVYQFQIEQLKAELYTKSEAEEKLRAEVDYHRNLSVSDIFSQTISQVRPIATSTPYRSSSAPVLSNQLEQTKQKVEKIHHKMTRVLSLRNSNQKMNSVLLNMAQDECRELMRLNQQLQQSTLMYE